MTPKARPLTLQPHEIPGLLSGEVSVLVRLVKPQPVKTDFNDWRQNYRTPKERRFMDSDGSLEPWVVCPLGAPGDVVWGRETWGYTTWEEVAYRADGEEVVNADGFLDAPKWRSPVTMPRWASRLTLRVEDVAVKRVQEVTEEEAEASGAELLCEECGEPFDLEKSSLGYCWRPDCIGSETWNFTTGFKKLFDAQHGPGAYEDNPWVWVARVKKEADSRV